MKPSYRLIDYSLRPAKFAERKMFCEFFIRLRPFSPVQSYQYVGLGSIWFADHLLFHKSLGIAKMVSIERVCAHKRRFEFNRPLKNIEILLGNATEHLPNLNWSCHTILWLDYEDPLTPGILDDVRTVATRAKSGTVLAVSTQAKEIYGPSDSEKETNNLPITTKHEFKELFGVNRTPSDLGPRELRGKKVGETIRRVLRDELDDAMLVRNVGQKQEMQVDFRQIGAFEYSDGVPMTTVVGIFVESREAEKYEACGFDELDFYRPDKKALKINVPKLTPREMRFLDRLLPGKLLPNNLAAIPRSDAASYAQLYRYLPNYASFEP